MNELENPFKLDVVSVRLVKDAPLYSKEPMNSPEKAVQRLGKELSEMDREVICIVNMTTKGVPINCSYVSIGTLDASLASPREMLKASILSNAAGIIMLHNHPSGDPSPSHKDLLLTEKLSHVCQFMGIELLDHIIVGGNTEHYFSFAEERISPLGEKRYEKIPDLVAEQSKKPEPKKTSQYRGRR